MPNQDQLMSILRWALTTLGSFLVTNGTVSSSAWQQITGIVMTLAPFVWGLVVHTQASTVMSAAAIPGVEPIRINSAAEPSLQKVAADRSVPSVVPASR